MVSKDKMGADAYIKMCNQRWKAREEELAEIEMKIEQAAAEAGNPSVRAGRNNAWTE